MVTPEYHQAVKAFDKAIDMALMHIGLDRAVHTFGNVTINVNGKSKEADWGWGPRRPPPGCPKKPAVAVEVAISKTQAKLRRDVDMWIDPARGNANIAIAMEVNRKTPIIITVDKWEWDSINQQSQNTQRIVIFSESETREMKSQSLNHH